MDDADDKLALRARMRAVRRRLAQADPQAAERAAGHLPLERLPAFAVFAGYHPMGAEMDPAPVIRRLLRTGALLALPAVEAVDAPLSFREWDERDPPARDAIGAPSPPRDAPILSPTLIVAPLLAFDARGGRLGQGGGYYDRTLANLRAARPVFVLGLAYAGQEIEQVPVDRHDQRLDAILTEAGFRELG